jgi:hypothetical protein
MVLHAAFLGAQRKTLPLSTEATVFSAVDAVVVGRTPRCLLLSDFSVPVDIVIRLPVPMCLLSPPGRAVRPPRNRPEAL